jgi:hypothetical protein
MRKETSGVLLTMPLIYTITKDCSGSLDGVTNRAYKAGQEVTATNRGEMWLMQEFVRNGSAVMGAAVLAERKTKVTKAPKTK